MFKRESQYSHVTREEFTQYMIRGKEGFERVHHRLKSLEDMRDELNRLITSIEKMASNVEHILKYQEKQEQKLDSHDARIDQLENKNGRKWDDIASHLWKAIVAAIGLYLLTKMGIG